MIENENLQKEENKQSNPNVLNINNNNEKGNCQSNREENAKHQEEIHK